MNVKKTETRKPVVDANESLVFTITEEDVKNAECKNSQKCVVAVAVKRKLGVFFEIIEVGPTVTKVVTRSEVIRFSTPTPLRRAIGVFDPSLEKTGHKEWPLPAGDYELLPLYKSRRKAANRQHKIKGDRNGKKVVFAGRRVPIRKVTRADLLV